MSNIFQRWVVAISLVTGLGACSSFSGHLHGTNGGWVSPLMVTSQADELLLYYDNLRKQTSAELSREYDKSRQSMAQNRSDVNRLRVALLLSLPNTAFHDNAAALGLANELLKENKSNSSGVRGLANLLSVSLTEQQRMAEDWSQKWRDEQKRADGLQDKVEAIKNMEKNLMRRDQH